MKTKKIEVMAPAGAFDSLSAALRAGADSVYFGLGKLNLRTNATANFTEQDIAKIVRLCKAANAKAYLTLNSIIYDDEIEDVRKICDIAKEKGVSAIIASDFAVIEYANSIDMPVHISVQANISNISSVRYFAKFADVIVLARELDLGKIHNICRTIEKEQICGFSGEPLKIEIFVHGALCMAISGKCYLSLAAYNKSSNRGECYQNCRRAYIARDIETGFEVLIDNKYLMSPKDLCTIRIIPEILAAGVSILKIEGRGRSPEYVYATVSAYKKAVELAQKGEFTCEKALKLEKELESVFNRGFWHGGYYLGAEAGEWSGVSGNAMKKKKESIGFVSNFYHKAGIAEITLNVSGVSKGDNILVCGKTTGAVNFTLGEFRVEEQIRQSAEKGEIITFPSQVKLRRGDKVYAMR